MTLLRWIFLLLLLPVLVIVLGVVLMAGALTGLDKEGEYVND